MQGEAVEIRLSLGEAADLGDEYASTILAIQVTFRLLLTVKKTHWYPKTASMII